MFKIIIQNFHLEKVFWIVKTKLKFMILVGLICGVIAGVVGLMVKKETYMAQISMYVYSSPDYITDNGINLSTADISSASGLLNSYMQILKSDSFLKSVVEEAELDPRLYDEAVLRDEISSAAVGGTAVFKVYVVDSDPYNAMLIANTIGKLAPQKIISIVKSGGIEILDEATLPTYPYESTKIIVFVAIGVFAGGFLSLMFFLIRGFLDTRYRRLYEVQDMFTIPIIGVVPEIEDKNDAGEPDVLLKQDSPFVLKEAYNDLRANLLFLGKGEKCPVYAITGADYDEGKTTTSINIAKEFAMMGKKTLLIDADLRNGNIANELKISAESGLSEYLAGIKDISIKNDTVDKLDVITTGAYPPNPTDLLIGEKWKNLIAEFKKKYEVIIIDTPSIGIVSDGLELVNVATAFVVVIRERSTRFEREELIIRRLEAVDADICGFVYNGISVESEDYNHKDYVNGGDYAKRSDARVQHRKLFKKKSGSADKSNTVKDGDGNNSSK
ncbi:polysaccharide biosynthesis tyrosine autokinase [Butyrivibrio sp. LC3010]|uniref:polysaccharide biosynthesis tyrosine autokinase n=1 Tax=Butyrivibrio sp. LC3010 TaxID=1280680 RepID=UPI0003FCA4EE|nr:polysaccharide biosynthesis tyrosine autokinase [Butyrivibrio sp. LC3010]